MLKTIEGQDLPRSEYELILVDSGSTDGTLEVARAHGCKEVFISREEFSFGRSLNRGCEAASGQVLVFVSAHCIPQEQDWLRQLIQPILDGRVVYAYGKQRGGGNTKFSEHQLFKKYFGNQSRIPQEGFFCNNANAALDAATWDAFRFDETVTGLEDMELAKRLLAAGKQIGYVAEAGVGHHHDETWRQVRWRYEREAIALQRIMPNIHVHKGDVARYWFAGAFLDWAEALQQRRFLREFGGIATFRFMQYLGAYRGNHKHRALSRQEKEHYFYPR